MATGSRPVKQSRMIDKTQLINYLFCYKLLLHDHVNLTYELIVVTIPENIFTNILFLSRTSWHDFFSELTLFIYTELS